MMHPSRVRRAVPAWRFAYFVFAHLLLMAVAVRPLHVHDLRVAADHTPQIEQAGTNSAFCFECTFGSDQIEFTAALDVVTPIASHLLDEALTQSAPSLAILSASNRGPPVS